MKIPLLSAAVFIIVPLLSIPFLYARAEGEKPLSGEKIICIWSIDAQDPEAVDNAVDQARELGFNAVCWDRPGVVASCHRRGMKACALFCPLGRREGAQMQELKAGEEKLPGFDRENIKPEQFYQHGGEPVEGNREILDQNFVCPNDPGVLEYTLKSVAQLMERGFDCVIFDFIGYRNYRSCECPLCRAKLEEFRKKHLGLSEQEAGDTFYRDVLIDLYETLYRETKARWPDLIIANHIHPAYLPDLFYAHRIMVDYCGVTVAWFFQPHWPLAKVREYTRKVVSGPYLNKGVEGMPMIGLYTDGEHTRDRKSPARLKQEFAILKESGARHLVMCELGHILRDKELAAVVREELTK
ncbi:MAG: hypothetical protein U9N45_00670 [Gemmatimonadota bacterium]|nr:hypothetical protein [Gemmatimonadota bacterium]